MTKHTLMLGDCLERIKELEDDSVELVITSPPYLNAKDYHKEETNVGNNESYDEYLGKIESLLIEINRVVVPGGVVCWNTSPVLSKEFGMSGNGKSGLRFGIPFDTHQLFIKHGFNFAEDICWNKGLGGGKLRCGQWHINGGRPMSWYSNIISEYIMIYKMPGDRPVGKFKPMEFYYPREKPKDLFTNIWNMNPETNKGYHDAPFPHELAKRLILLYSYLGETVLDPFGGSFTVGKVAKELERDSIMMELSPEYYELGKEEIGFHQTSLIADAEFIEK